MAKVRVEIDGETIVAEVNDDGAVLYEILPTMPWRKPQGMMPAQWPCWCGCDCEDKRRIRRERQLHLLKERLFDYECLFLVYPTCKVDGCVNLSTAGFTLGRPGSLYGKWLEADDFLDLCLGHSIDGAEADKILRHPRGGPSRSNEAETFACRTTVVKCQSHSDPELRAHKASRKMILLAELSDHLRPVDLTTGV